MNISNFRVDLTDISGTNEALESSDPHLSVSKYRTSLWNRVHVHVSGVKPRSAMRVEVYLSHGSFTKLYMMVATSDC